MRGFVDSAFRIPICRSVGVIGELIDFYLMARLGAADGKRKLSVRSVAEEKIGSLKSC
jgi:hypothetical protein